VPAIFDNREAVVSGVLMSYAIDFGDVFRQSSIYVGRILKGEKPADLPVAQTRKFEFVINRPPERLASPSRLASLLSRTR
jgi:putative ABC transport system substrate-binding protein